MSFSFSTQKKFKEGLKLPWIIPVLGVMISIYIMTQCELNQILIGTALILVGIPVYVLFAPKTEITTVKRDLKQGEDYVSRTIETDEIFLAKFLNQVKELITRIKNRFD